MEQEMKLLQKSAVDVVADYLRRLWGHAISILQNSFGAVFMDNTQIKLILTVPALWDHSAQELTRKAAERAGITDRAKIKVELVSGTYIHRRSLQRLKNAYIIIMQNQRLQLAMSSVLTCHFKLEILLWLRTLEVLMIFSAGTPQPNPFSSPPSA
jgi:hypothetical protein